MSRVAFVHVWRTDEMIGGSSELLMWLTDGVFGHYLWQLEGSSAHTREFRCGRTFTRGGTFTCRGDIHVCQMLTYRGCFTCRGEIHMWRGHSHVEGTFTCGGDIHMWQVLICTGCIIVWMGGAHMWRGHPCVGGAHIWRIQSCGRTTKVKFFTAWSFLFFSYTIPTCSASMLDYKAY